MMPDADKTSGFNSLIYRGENYVQRPGGYTPAGVRAWQSSCTKWLKANAPEFDFARDVLLVSPPRAGYYHVGGLSTQEVRNVQRVLKVLYRARDALPSLAELRNSKAPRAGISRRVFVVHGHDDALKTSVARLLERLDLEPVVLHEQPNLGRTIIEKFLDCSDVAFAVVLLTADDRGGLVCQPAKQYQLRARQNVVLELGYFMGRLGRKRVAAIYQQDVELPSDYSGVLFIPHDESGVWQLQLAKEIKATGIKVDLNRL